MDNAKKITREEAEHIMIEYNKSGLPRKRLVCAFKGQWYDVHDLNDTQFALFVKELTGSFMTPENTVDIEVGDKIKTND